MTFKITDNELELLFNPADSQEEATEVYAKNVENKQTQKIHSLNIN